MKKVIYFIAVCITLGFLEGCENEAPSDIEENATLQEEAPNISLEVLSSEDLPSFSKTLSVVSGESRANWSSKSKKGDIVLDETRILAVTDSVGNISYSARMYVPDTPYNVFYNVIAKVTAEGEQRPPFVLRYEIDEAYYQTYKTTSREKAPFKGIKKVYSLNHFLEGGSESQKTGDHLSVYCGKIVHNGDSPNGSPTNGGGGNPNGADNGGSYDYINNGHIWYIFPTNTTGGDDATTPIVEVGEGNFGEFGTDGVLKSAAVAAKDPECPEELLLVPINEEDILDVEDILEALMPDYPIEDLAKFLECFDKNDSATITVYANQPVKGSELAGSITNLDVGHAFISIQQYENIATFGFYPEGQKLDAMSGPSTIGNNGGDSFDVSISKEVNGNTLSKIINSAVAYEDNYHLSNYNCTDYAIELGNLAGMNIPSASGTYPIPSRIPIQGSNPGKLGEVLKSMDGKPGIKINKYGTTAPSKSHGCIN